MRCRAVFSWEMYGRQLGPPPKEQIYWLGVDAFNKRTIYKKECAFVVSSVPDQPLEKMAQFLHISTHENPSKLRLPPEVIGVMGGYSLCVITFCMIVLYMKEVVRCWACPSLL